MQSPIKILSKVLSNDHCLIFFFLSPNGVALIKIFSLPAHAQNVMLYKGGCTDVALTASKLYFLLSVCAASQ